ncbi:tetratricopeptide repeat protein [Flavihumibacter fluvii]|uniref:tetratricopeptide repeat protein n=1 Tax=Flavihumibacter fluvii TaxID=2838157 RepID=UPI001BDE3869|nr:tetratricopeptide repeat protein [Flavihumibacter fluvii]ULQ53940.1 tetratricopeptide repeat protein [Flavihumibacter fluvii]
MKKLLFTVCCCSLATFVIAQSDSLNHYLKLGEDALSRGQVLPAYQAYKQAVSFDEKNLEAARGLAFSAKELRYAAIARESYKRVLELKPNDTSAINQLAQLNFATRQWAAAIEMAKRSIALGIGSKNEWVIAKSYYELGEFGSSVEYLEKAWRKDSSLADIPFTAARCYVEMSNYRKAAGCYEQALRLSPDNETWMYETAMTYSAIPDEAKAIPWFEKAIEKGYPRTKDVIENMAISYMGIKSYDKCLALVNEVLPSKPEDLELWYLSGEANFRSGKIDAAITCWDKMLSIDKNQARALYMIGIAYIKKGDPGKGENLCDKAIAMDPSLSRLKNQRSQFGL